MKENGLELQVFLEHKREYMAHLIDLLTEPIVDGIQAIYEDAVDGQRHALKSFQDALAQVARWNTLQQEQAYSRVCERSRCNYLPDLLRAILTTFVKIELVSLPKHAINKVQLRVPTVETFVHKCYVHAARNLWKRPHLMYHNVKSIERQHNRIIVEEIVRKSIQSTVRACVPLEQLLRMQEQVAGAHLPPTRDSGGRARAESTESEESDTTDTTDTTDESDRSGSEDADSELDTGYALVHHNADEDDTDEDDTDEEDTDEEDTDEETEEEDTEEEDTEEEDTEGKEHESAPAQPEAVETREEDGHAEYDEYAKYDEYNEDEHQEANAEDRVEDHVPLTNAAAAPDADADTHVKHVTWEEDAPVQPETGSMVVLHKVHADPVPVEEPVIDIQEITPVSSLRQSRAIEVSDDVLYPFNMMLANVHPPSSPVPDRPVSPEPRDARASQRPMRKVAVHGSLFQPGRIYKPKLVRDRHDKRSVRTQDAFF